MLEAIKYNLLRLADFSGREDRPTFWWYVLFLVILDLVLGFIGSGWLFAGSMSAIYQTAQSGGSPVALQQQMMQQMVPHMMTMLWVSGAIKLLFAALCAAAFVRRLHDSDSSGWWAALAFGVQILSLALVFSMADQIESTVTSLVSGDLTPALQGRNYLSKVNLLGWIAPIVVLVFGVMKSSPGPNKYGEAPQAT